MTPIGYTYLNQHYKLLLPKLDVEVYQDPKSETESLRPYGTGKRKILPRHLKTPVSPWEHMVAAIKHQGIRLHFFSAIFRIMDVKAFTAFVAATPNSNHNRVLWHLYEWLMDEALALPDLKSGNYIDLFDESNYYTVKDGWRDRRTRVRNNAIGTAQYCPTIRKTSKLRELTSVNIYDSAYAHIQKVDAALSTNVLGRSLNYLYTKETKCSSGIEHNKPAKRKLQRFLNAVKNAGLFELSKEKLINVQNQIVSESLGATDYRTSEAYIGSAAHRLGETDEDVRYIGAPAKHLESMMQGLLAMHEKLMLDGQVPALVHAAIVSFAEAYIRPFNDGNGRLHRYLIHDVLRQREPGHAFIIPISAAILKNRSEYIKVLESVSGPLMAMLDYHFDDKNCLTINNNIDHMYRFPEFTDHVVFVYEMMTAAISEDLIQELLLMTAFDSVKSAVHAEADIPNNEIDTLVAILLSGGGKISNSKRPAFLEYLADRQITQLEGEAVRVIKYTAEGFGVDAQALMNGSEKPH